MPASEFVEWMAYEQLEPFGDRRGDFQAGMICAATYNQHRTKPADRVFNPTDFIPQWDPSPERPPQTIDEQLEMMLLIQKVQNASIGSA